MAPSLVALAALGLGCGGEESGLTYEKNISTLFADCVLCHSPGAPFGPGKGQGPDMVDLHSEPNGLLVSPTQWWEGHMDLQVPTRVVTPGQPDNSFLINKLTNQLPLNDRGGSDAGAAMPQQIEPITPNELARIEQWVSDGAQDNDYYWTQVDPIFVNPIPIYPGKCNACHYDGSPYPPDVTDPFGPNGLVGIKSVFRSDMLRVAPGEPDASLLVWRVRLSAGEHLPDDMLPYVPNSKYGAPMPKPTPLLDSTQVDLVRQWIAEGARP